MYLSCYTVRIIFTRDVMTFSSLFIGTAPHLFQNILWSKIDSHIAPRFRPG